MNLSMRLALLSLAWLMVGLGIVGIFLPLLPTTPFLLLAVWLFSRSSPRLAKWLMDHPLFGPPLGDWREEGAISRRAKISAVLLMSLALIYCGLRSNHRQSLCSWLPVSCSPAVPSSCPVQNRQTNHEKSSTRAAPCFDTSVCRQCMRNRYECRSAIWGMALNDSGLQSLAFQGRSSEVQLLARLTPI